MTVIIYKLGLATQNGAGHGICGVAALMFFQCGDAVDKISNCGVAVISNPTVCDVCVFHAAVFGEMKLFAVLGSFDLPFSNLNLT